MSAPILSIVLGHFIATSAASVAILAQAVFSVVPVMGRLIRVSTQSTYPQFATIRELSFTRYIQVTQQLMLSILYRYWTLAGVDVRSRKVLNLIDATRRYAFVSACMVVHRVASSNSLGDYAYARLPADKHIYDAMRNTIPLKEFPSDRVDQLTCYMLYLLKLVRLNTNNSQFEVVPEFNDKKITSVELAKQLIVDEMRSTTSGINQARTLPMVVAHYNTVTKYLET